MRAMRAEQFSGYERLKLVELPKPEASDGRVLLAKEAPQANATNSSGYHDRKRVSKGLSGREFVSKI